MKKYLSIVNIFILCILFLSISLGIYFWHFNSKFSTQANFGAFGDYINPFLTFISIVLLFYISNIANEISTRTNEITQAFNKIQLQPLLFLSKKMTETTINQDDQQIWIIQNGYDAPAINILVRICLDSDGNNFTKWVNCFSISRDKEREIAWIQWAETIEIIWTNLSNKKFFGITYKDWVGTINNDISESYYSFAFNDSKPDKSKSHIIRVNNIISNDFFINVSKNPLLGKSKEEYEKYLVRIGLLRE
ncbi:hypothetical protein [Hymenobacter sp. GOD-10R]|uniref:hypothetical protein n=1 Tax=Hymenobacter sp. GOD-10R TaxID=3093922 RepID=UPI002D79D42E|nr:hypothetical protein [Hymenobacter sp. GOD-10R]WRQ31722.1 hypothetical protein SD425_28845 [Hymenobacter sp. GOD-10R]